jgi:choline dehydrogenase-like flavoprotein
MFRMSAVPVGRIDEPTSHPAHATPANDADGPERDPFSGAHTWQPSAREEEIVVALAAAAMPSGTILEGGGRGTLSRLYRMMRGAPAAWKHGYRAMLWSAELAPVATRFKTLSRMSRDDAESFLDAWSNGRTHLQRSLLRAVLTPIKYAHFDAPSMFAHVGCRYETPPVLVEERPRWLERVTDGREMGDAREGTLELEAEVVIVGTGAGGASAAYELARRGHAVLMIEEGDYHRRGAFTGRANDMTKLLYRDMGLTLALGNVGIPVWAGRAVGGSTTINSGTCYRTPERTFSRWRARYGLSEFSSDSLSPFYERVESMLQVAPAKREHLGGVGRVVERGARRLGLVNHHPIRRNAPDCDGQGICCFGCPTAAKRSTDVSYVPEALKIGAELLTAAKVEKVDVVAGRARGISGKLRTGRPFVVRAKAVIVAAGTIYTPGILRASGLRHRWIGKNLSIHPATKVMASYDEVVDQSTGIPQGYAIEDLADEGIMLEGGSAPFDVTAIGVPYVGRRFMDVMANFSHMATFGMMVQDVSRGSILSGPGRKPIIKYDLGDYDLARMQKGVVKLSELFRASGAKNIYPFVVGSYEVRTQGEIDALARRTLKPGDIEVMGFHPLGTARIGTDEERSVLTPEGESREVGGLYVMDGAAIPSSLGVNPQMTIMAMSLRACERLSAKLNASE